MAHTFFAASYGPRYGDPIATFVALDPSSNHIVSSSTGAKCVARILGGWDDKSESVRVTGIGMDMGFHVVYSLSLALFNDGYALNQRWLS